LADINTSPLRGLLVGGAVVVWGLGLAWVLNRKGIVMTSRPDSTHDYAVNDASDPANPRQAWDEDEVAEIVVEVGPSEAELELARKTKLAAEVAIVPVEVVEDQGPPTYSVWFESERDIGVCKINYAGGSKTANLHVAARLPEGKLSFSYQCGKYSGRASIDVLPKRVNGVLFCKEPGGVTVQQVRSKDGRCGSR
jgi:hypothetical protein